MKKKILSLLIATSIIIGASSVVMAKDVESVKDLEGKKIGVQLGTTGDLEASKYEAKGSKVERYSKGQEAIQALKGGKIDCVVIDTLPADKFIENNKDLKELKEPFIKEEYAACFKKGNSKLQKEFNKALEELKKDGTIKKIMSNYIGDKKGESKYESPKDAKNDKGTLVMGTNAEFEPYEYHEGEDIVGIDVDIAKAICDKLGYKLKIEDMEFDAILPAVSSGKVDFGMAGMSVTEDRKSSVDFSDTYADASQVIIVKK